MKNETRLLSDHSNTPALEPKVLAYSARDAMKALSIGRTQLWRLEKLGHLRPVRCLGKKLYTVKDLERYLRSLSVGLN